MLGARRARPHECPLCGTTTRSFAPFHGRRGAQCPACGSLERQRLLWVWMRRGGLLDQPLGRVAHFAPERALEQQLRQLPHTSYVTADLTPGAADEVVDVTSIPWPDGSVDLLLCSHVLEHVPDDRAAMAELRRVLAPGGTALIHVPVLAERTVEDPSVTDPAERRRLFGQEDHVRVYGPDYYERLEEAGFEVEHHDVRPLVSAQERSRFGLEYEGVALDVEDPRLWQVPVCR